jgi:hypothetical protein
VKLIKKNDRKDSPDFKKNINPQRDNQINSQKENNGDSKSDGSDKIEKDTAYLPKNDQVI